MAKKISVDDALERARSRRDGFRHGYYRNGATRVLADEVVALRAKVARVEAIVAQCDTAVAAFGEAALLPENELTPVAQALHAAVNQIAARLRAALRGENGGKPGPRA